MANNKHASIWAVTSILLNGHFAKAKSSYTLGERVM
jgi:hypothetical protein